MTFIQIKLDNLHRPFGSYFLNRYVFYSLCFSDWETIFSHLEICLQSATQPRQFKNFAIRFYHPSLPYNSKVVI